VYDDPQVDLSKGEEETNEEECLVIEKVKAMKYTKEEGWKSKGIGVLKVLRHRETSKIRVLMRKHPIGAIIINTLPLKSLKYDKPQATSVRFPLVSSDGKSIEQWLIKTAKESDAAKLQQELTKAAEANDAGNGSDN
jgi:hypothetical protein